MSVRLQNVAMSPMMPYRVGIALILLVKCRINMNTDASTNTIRKGNGMK
jgi:hypothetical protein